MHVISRGILEKPSCWGHESGDFICNLEGRTLWYADSRVQQTEWRADSRFNLAKYLIRSAQVKRTRHVGVCEPRVDMEHRIQHTHPSPYNFPSRCNWINTRQAAAFSRVCSTFQVVV